MKSKFQNFDFGSVEVLSRDEQNKVKGGAYGFGQYGGSGGSFGPPPKEWNPPTYECFKAGYSYTTTTNSCPDGYNIR
jgi:hypothetical protein